MNAKEIKMAKKMLASLCSQMETISNMRTNKHNGYILSVIFESDGWQKMFYTIDEIKSYLTQKD